MNNREEFIKYVKEKFPHNWQQLLELSDNQVKQLNGELTDSSSFESAAFKLAIGIANQAFNMPDIKPLNDEELNDK